MLSNWAIIFDCISHDNDSTCLWAVYLNHINHTGFNLESP